MSFSCRHGPRKPPKLAASERTPFIAVRLVDIMYFYTATVRDFYRPTRELYAAQPETTEVGEIAAPVGNET